MNCGDIEMAIKRHYDPRRNLIVPNVSWGFGVHECDMLVVSKSGYATEIEIKVSKGDLIKDAKKEHKHESRKICRLYFAIPKSLSEKIGNDVELMIPSGAGLIEVSEEGNLHFRIIAKDKNRYKLTVQEMYVVARLGAIKYWSIREKLEYLIKNPAVKI